MKRFLLATAVALLPCLPALTTEPPNRQIAQMQIAEAFSQGQVSVPEILLKRDRKTGLYWAQGQVRNDSGRTMRSVEVTFEILPFNNRVTVNGRRKVIDTQTVTIKPRTLSSGTTAEFKTYVQGRGEVNILSVEWLWEDGTGGRQ